MNKAAIYHRPESEFAYLYAKNLMHVRLQTQKSDVEKVELFYGDPYSWEGLDNPETQYWASQKVEMKKYLSTNISDYFEAEITVATKRVDYLFVITGLDGEKVVYTDQGMFDYDESLVTKKYGAFRLPYFHESDRFKAPEWVKETVWYQIFPERFSNGDKSNDPEGTKAWNPQDVPDRQDFYGGDLQGVIDHLEHLTELGVNGIYFTPIFQAFSNHKYDTEDYMEIDKQFGDKELFKTLVKEAHARGIKVMLDAVFNHIGDTSAQWQDVLKNQEKSKFADWFHVNSWPATYTPTDDFENAENATYDTFAFTPHMPKLNTANPEVEAYLLKVADYWISEFDIDAWRLDVADEVDHTFWKKFRTTCDAAKDDFYILGEVWHSAQPWLVGDEFSAVMNYAYTDAIKDGLITKKISLEQMVSNINTQLTLYRKQVNQMMFNVLDSHDTPRILTVAKNNKNLMKLVETFTFMQPGVPCIYYGDEYAVTGGMDPECRKVMPWEEKDQDLEMFDFFKNLIALRKQYQGILSDSEVEWKIVDSENGIVKFERGSLKAIFNIGEKPAYFSADEVVFSNLVDQNNILQYGFVIYK
ncbi:glycoside hydrolase family 13 protein [Lactococcus lactis]|uniref:glycoside hydrolase family 13 protein n=1 Tax=Lactococcus lactis TaxID=1358 RepID=UPI002418AEAF|nr:glycoside hydrolase family 13 protein [Lactococcus lactis]MDG4965484.1 glycoside hydrolase family 13 protein [Lactococcus lactis]